MVPACTVVAESTVPRNALEASESHLTGLAVTSLKWGGQRVFSDCLRRLGLARAR